MPCALRCSPLMQQQSCPASQSARLWPSLTPALRAGFGQKAAAEGDEAALQDLLHACLGGTAELHARLASLIVRASSAAESCRTSGTPKASWQPVCDILSTAVASLKQQVPPLPGMCAARWAAVSPPLLVSQHWVHVCKLAWPHPLHAYQSLIDNCAYKSAAHLVLSLLPCLITQRVRGPPALCVTQWKEGVSVICAAQHHDFTLCHH